YVVQGHRFDIYKDVGRYPFIYNTLPAFFLFDSWPIIIGLVFAVYCGLSLRAFYCRRVEFNHFLAASMSLNASSYFRLMALATTKIFALWENVHHDFSHVARYDSILWTICALIFFAFFGFAAEARKNYVIAFWWAAKIFGFSPAKSQHYMNSIGYNRTPRAPAMIPSAGSLAIYVAKERKRTSSLALSWEHSLDEKKAAPASEMTPWEASFPHVSYDDAVGRVA
ncbi:pheromone A receptor-domain-containing protein, partial [Suillus clintonianus]|uniref:pheromone A receptor-domain-containing protein n=1 Tax=Suillus clintonianus TaxID=1904413 RepID=UPI001B861B5A